MAAAAEAAEAAVAEMATAHTVCRARIWHSATDICCATGMCCGRSTERMSPVARLPVLETETTGASPVTSASRLRGVVWGACFGGALGLLAGASKSWHRSLRRSGVQRSSRSPRPRHHLPQGQPRLRHNLQSHLLQSRNRARECHRLELVGAALIWFVANVLVAVTEQEPRFRETRPRLRKRSQASDAAQQGPMTDG